MRDSFVDHDGRSETDFCETQCASYWTSQRAAIAIELIPEIAKETKRSQVAYLKQGQQNSPLPSKDGNGKGRATEIAGKALNVSRSVVERAARIQRKDPQGYSSLSLVCATNRARQAEGL
jgi:hypothetical protein